MASFLNVALPSDDEEDDDFVPSDADSEEKAANKKPTKKRKAVRGAAIGAVSDKLEEDEEEEPVVTGPSARQQTEKKVKVDELWSKLNAKPAAQDKPKSTGFNLASLCRPMGSKAKSAVDESWKTQLGLAPKPSKRSEPDPHKKAAAAAALAAAKSAASMNAAQQYGMVSVTETRRFAGKNITMTKTIAAGSKEAATTANGGATTTAGNGSAATETDAAKQRNKTGLDSVLASLEQAKKIGVLDKSRADWKDFKSTNEKIDEELEVHKRSGAAFLEKQAFLGRTEMREYEKERDARLSSDVRNRGRL